MQEKREEPKERMERIVCVGEWLSVDGEMGKRAFKMQLCNHLAVTKEEKGKSEAKKSLVSGI